MGALIPAIVRVTRFTLIRSATKGLWKHREETALYASSVFRGGNLGTADSLDRRAHGVG
jgi:hypothetical protein